MRVVVVDVDAAVTAMCREHMGYDDAECGIETHVHEGLAWLRDRAPEGGCDLIIVDAYESAAAPSTFAPYYKSASGDLAALMRRALKPTRRGSQRRAQTARARGVDGTV